MQVYNRSRNGISPAREIVWNFTKSPSDSLYCEYIVSRGKNSLYKGKSNAESQRVVRSLSRLLVPADNDITSLLFCLSPQMTLHSPGTELVNITFQGAWAIRGNFSHGVSRTSRMPPAFYICSEDLRLLGIRPHLFGTVCFVLVYAVPGK